MTRFPARSRTRTSLPLGLLVVGAVALPLLAGCSAEPSSAADAEPAPPETLGISGLPGSSPVAVAPTTDPATTTPATTEPPTTTPATAPPTTEPEPTEPPSTIPFIPERIEVVGPANPPVTAVGTTNGPGTAAVQRRLLELGFWHAGVDGSYGDTTMQAVMAFQKYHGLKADGKVDDTTAEWLNMVTERARGASNSGTLVEIDKAKQVLFIVVDGRTVWAMNTSTGSEKPYETPNKNDPTKIEKGDSVTPNGIWKVNRQREQGWWEGDLGEIYRPKYFKGGIAIHGMTSVPNYPASHGCVRVSVGAMDFIWAENLVPMGTTIWVHG